MAKGIQTAGEFEIEELNLVTTSGLEVDLTTSVIGLTLYEDIFSMTISGTIAIADSANLASYGPLLGQEYLHLKISTIGFDDESAVIDFSKNALLIHCIAKGEKLTEWHKVVVWDEKIAEVLQKYTRKGSKVLLQGRLTYKTWDKEGIQMKQAEVHLDRFESKMEMLDSKSESKSSQNEMDDFGSDKTYENETTEDVPF